MKQETLEEAHLNKLIDEANKEFTLDRKLAKEVSIKFAKFQQERSYSEEEVKQLLLKSLQHRILLDDIGIPDWFEQFKKK